MSAKDEEIAVLRYKLEQLEKERAKREIEQVTADARKAACGSSSYRCCPQFLVQFKNRLVDLVGKVGGSDAD